MLAAFYLIPVWMEQKWINTGGILGVNLGRYIMLVPDQWPEGRTPLWVLEMWAYVCVSVLVIAICIFTGRRWRRQDSHNRFWMYLALIALFFNLPLSLPLWNFLPEMHAVQFAFRFLPYLGVAVPMVLFAKDTPVVLRKPVYLVMLLVTLIPIRSYLRATPVAQLRKDSFAQLEAKWERYGYWSPPEYSPLDISGFGLRPVDNRPGVGAPSPPGEQLCSIAPVPLRTRNWEFATDSNRACTAVLDVYFYPYWHALTESGTFLTTAGTETLLLSVKVPPGKHTVQVFFEPNSTARTLSATVSLLAWAFVILYLICTVGSRFHLIRETFTGSPRSCHDGA